MTRLYAVAKTEKSTKQITREAVKQFRQKPFIPPGGFIGERFNHRGWLPEVVLAFMAAPIIKPEKGEIQRRLYARLP